MRRFISLIVALSMMLTALSAVAEAAVATWLAPEPGQIVAGKNVEVAVGYNTQSDTKVTKLELWIDGEFAVRKVLTKPASRGVASFVWNTSNASRGSHDLVVKIFAGNSLISTISGVGTVGDEPSRGGIDVRPPVVVFANIKSGDVLKGKTCIKMNASDDSGEAPLVSLLVDESLKLLKNTPPYTYDLDTTTYKNGDHQLKTYAYDSAGNQSDPSVVKVSFRNDSEKPVVAALSVNTHSDSRSVAPSEDDGTGQVLTPAVSSPVPSVSDTGSAARIRNSESSARLSGNPASPVASVPEVKAEMKIGPAAAPEKHAAPASSAKPESVAASTEPASVRHENTSTNAGSSRAIEPGMIGGARTSYVAVNNTPRLPESKLTSSASRLPDAAVEPDTPLTSEAPSKSGVVQMAMVPRGSVRTGSESRLSDSTASVPEAVAGEPARSDVESVSANGQSPRLRTSDLNSSAAGEIARMPESSIPSGEAVSSSPKAVRVAMAPGLFKGDINSRANAAFACPPPAPKSTKARIEKTVTPKKGKVKARCFFEDLGGILFWDSATHTVTAFVSDMKIEMKIGSNIARVNGTEMILNAAPYIVNGRTVMDAGIYYRALAMVNSGKAPKMAFTD